MLKLESASSEFWQIQLQEPRTLSRPLCVIPVPTAESAFHVYALEWTPDFIKGFVDGQCHFTFLNDKKGDKNSWPFNVPFYVKLNLAWGGNWGGAEGVDETRLPATYEIDYVRIFQKK